jgi:hypothetical protein
MKKITKKATPAPAARDFDKDGELYARLLENKGTPDSFRKAFGSLYVECMMSYSGVTLEEPEIVRVLFPFILDRLDEGYASTMLESLTHVRDALVPDAVVEKVLAETHKLFEHRAICGCSGAR